MSHLCPLGGSLVLALGGEGSGMVCWQRVGWWGWGTALTLCLQEYQGTLERDGQSTLPVTGRAGDALDVLLENMGRLSFGANFSDFKVRGNSQTLHRPHPGTLSPAPWLILHYLPLPLHPPHGARIVQPLPWDPIPFPGQTPLPHFPSSTSGLAGEPLLGLQPAQQLAHLPPGHRHCHPAGLAPRCPATTKQQGQIGASLLHRHL